MGISFVTLNLFFFFIHPASAPLLLAGSSVAYVAGCINSYFWNGRWTFGVKPSRQSALRYCALTVVAMSINAVILWSSSGLLLNSVLPSWASVNLSQISGMISGSADYLVCRQWVFRI